MKNTINKIKKGGKIYSKILFLVIIGVSILFMVNIINIKKVTVADRKNIHIEKIDKSFSVIINNKNYGELENYDASINDNCKELLIINLVSNEIKLIFLFSIGIIIYRILVGIGKDTRPFTKLVSKRIKLISILILLVALIPTITRGMLSFFLFSKGEMFFSSYTLILIFISCVVWGISYAVDYGCDLQQEIDETL
ncbi:putative membrane protein [Clostridium bornimense]|uniref:Putative membrane protein n=1 Tax=Clostridium bornimense TaxID=1216932 RepID=W6S193_9CLOT|nr:hypothetical protein [Clostridium bornimense]CDM68057.1 putative membrane protein [Clostridium bornimense]